MTREQIGLGFKGILNSIPVIVGALVGANLTGATLFMLIEDGHSFTESIYWSFVTSMGVGYGDVTPTTTAGRFLAIGLAAFVLYVITPLVVGKFVMSALEDQNAFTHDEQEFIKREVHEISVTMGGLEVTTRDTLFLLNEIQKTLDRAGNVR